MKRDLYILGAGGQAKDTLCLVKDVNAIDDLYAFRGFVSVGGEESVRFGGHYHAVFDETVFFNEMLTSDTRLALGSGDPDLNRKIVEKVPIPHLFPNLIHSNFIGNREGIEFGEGNLICAGNVWTSEIQVGSYNIFNPTSVVGHDSTIGSYNVLNPGCRLSGGVALGDANLIGTGATLLQYLKVGNRSIVGGGALIDRDVASGSVVVGVPGRVIKER